MKNNCKRYGNNALINDLSRPIQLLQRPYQNGHFSETLRRIGMIMKSHGDIPLHRKRLDQKVWHRSRWYRKRFLFWTRILSWKKTRDSKILSLTNTLGNKSSLNSSQNLTTNQFSRIHFTESYASWMRVSKHFSNIFWTTKSLDTCLWNNLRVAHHLNKRSRNYSSISRLI